MYGGPPEDSKHYALFAQDDWKVSQRLTLNFGLRWEYHPAFQDKNNDVVNVSGIQLMAKQYSSPAPPVLTRFSWLQPRLGWVEFHDVLPPPVRSK